MFVRLQGGVVSPKEMLQQRSGNFGKTPGCPVVALRMPLSVRAAVVHVAILPVCLMYCHMIFDCLSATVLHGGEVLSAQQQNCYVSMSCLFALHLCRSRMHFAYILLAPQRCWIEHGNDG